jgi:CHAT domain-containing protein
VSGWHPGLLSGLVLAGANKDTGILTALEVAELDLSGVQLAVLSACETGLGQEHAGEGLLGLQRAFQMAGARATVCSLWSVHDAATAVLMEEFYARLWRKSELPAREGTLEALRQAQLRVLHNPDLVQKRIQKLRAELAQRGVGESELEARGLGRKAVEVQHGGTRDAPRSPVAWWAAFVLAGDWR